VEGECCVDFVKTAVSLLSECVSGFVCHLMYSDCSDKTSHSGSSMCLYVCLYILHTLPEGHVSLSHTLTHTHTGVIPDE